MRIAHKVGALVVTVSITLMTSGAQASQTSDRTEVGPVVRSDLGEKVVEPEAMQVAQAVRASIGLDASADVVARLAEDSAAVNLGVVALGLGLPVTESEAEYIDSRLRTQSDLNAAVEFSMSLDSTIRSGYWFDFAANEFVLGVTIGELASISRDAEGLRTNGRPVRVLSQSYSESQLLEFQQRVPVDEQVVFGSHIAPQLNKLVVFVDGQSAVGDLSDFADRRGIPVDALVLEEFVSGVEDESVPIGGHNITSDKCSAGGWAWDSGESDWLMITAEHCPDVMYHQPRHGPEYRLVERTWPGFAGIDYGDSQSVQPASNQGPSNDIENWTNSSQNFQITSASDPVVGQWVCNSGFVTAGVSHCGTISAAGPNTTCLSAVGYAFVNYGSKKGDSGAAIYNPGSWNTSIRGIHKGIGCPTSGGSPRKMFDPQSRIISRLGLSYWRTS